MQAQPPALFRTVGPAGLQHGEGEGRSQQQCQPMPRGTAATTATKPTTTMRSGPTTTGPEAQREEREIGRTEEAGAGTGHIRDTNGE